MWLEIINLKISNLREKWSNESLERRKTKVRRNREKPKKNYSKPLVMNPSPEYFKWEKKLDEVENKILDLHKPENNKQRPLK